MRTTELNEEQIKKLFSDTELYLNSSNKSIHLFDIGEGLQMEMNYKGEGYRPVRMEIEWEYDPLIRFTQNEKEE